MISQEVLSKPQPLDADSAQWVIDQWAQLVRGQGGPTALREVALNLLHYLRAKGYNAPEDILKSTAPVLMPSTSDTSANQALKLLLIGPLKLSEVSLSQAQAVVEQFNPFLRNIVLPDRKYLSLCLGAVSPIDGSEYKGPTLRCLAWITDKPFDKD